MDKKMRMIEIFEEVETEEEYSGYFCSAGEALAVAILGSLCGLKNISQIHKWATNQRVREFLSIHFGIERLPCYYWYLCLLKLVKPTSLNKCFTKWTESLLAEGTKNLTISFDGKTIRSTGKMERYEKRLHIISAQIAELGITLGRQATDDKSNEIPAVRELIKLLSLEGCMVVADALNCQKDTARVITEAKADYLLSVKDNHQALKEHIEDYVQDDDLRKEMDTFSTLEKQSGRIEKRYAYETCDIAWLAEKVEWEGLACIGAVNTQFTSKKGHTDEWHYYISNRELTAEELLKRARLEWSVETMHWLFYVHFSEDFCRVEDKNAQQNLNIIRKIALNSIKVFKEKSGSKRPISKIMLDCLLDQDFLSTVLDVHQN